MSDSTGGRAAPGRRDALIFLVFFLVAMTSVAVPLAYLADLEVNSATGAPSPGTTLTYRFEITQSGPLVSGLLNSGLNPTIPLSPTAQFYMDLRGSYGQVVDQYRASGFIQGDPATDCQIASSDLYLTIRVINNQHDSERVNATLTFGNGYAVCGSGYGALPRVDGSWAAANGSESTSFKTLNLTGMILIQPSSSAAESPSGYPYGEWPFWLNSQDLKQGDTLVLYGLLDGVKTGLPVNGVAELVPLNSSRVAALPYSASGVYSSASGQMFGDRGVLIPVQVIRNVSAATAGAVTSYARQVVANCVAFGSCSSAFGPAGYPSADYANGTIITANNSLLNSLRLPYKGWTFSANITSTTGPVRLNGTRYPSSTYFYGVKYNGTSYVTAGLSLGSLDAVSYSRGGPLLYMTVQSQGDLTPVLAGPVVRGFGIVYPSAFGGTQVSIMLVRDSS